MLLSGGWQVTQGANLQFNLTASISPPINMFQHPQESPTLPSGVSLSQLLRDCPEDVRSRYRHLLPQRPPPPTNPAVTAAPTSPAAAAKSRSSAPPPGAPSNSTSPSPARGGGGGGGSAAAAVRADEQRTVQQALAVAQLHREFREGCDIMGIGLGMPRGDTVAEVRS